MCRDKIRIKNFMVNSFVLRTVVRQDRIRMSVDRIVDETQQFERAVLDTRKALLQQLGHILPSEAVDQMAER